MLKHHLFLEIVQPLIDTIDHANSKVCSKTFDWLTKACKSTCCKSIPWVICCYLLINACALAAALVVKLVLIADNQQAENLTLGLLFSSAITGCIVNLIGIKINGPHLTVHKAGIAWVRALSMTSTLHLIPALLLAPLFDDLGLRSLCGIASALLTLDWSMKSLQLLLERIGPPDKKNRSTIKKADSLALLRQRVFGDLALQPVAIDKFTI